MDWTHLNQFRNLADTMKANPRFGLASLGVGVIAPRLIQNNDRGYVESSLITTPLVAAGAVAYSATRRLIDKEIKTYNGLIKDAYQRVTEVDRGPMSASRFKIIADEYSKGNIRTSQFRRYQSEFFSTSTKKTSILNQAIPTLQNGINNAWDSKFSAMEIGARERYLENAIHSSLLNTLSMKDLVNYRKSIRNSPIAPILGKEGIESIVADQINKGNEAFIRQMNFKLGKLGKTKFAYNGVALNSNKSVANIAKHTWDDLDWNKTDLLSSLQSNHPELFNAIQSNVKSGSINPKQFNVVFNETNPIGFEYGKTKVSIVGENGRIISGKNWNKSGVSRGFWDLQGTYKTDLFALQNIGMSGLKEDLSRAYLINGVDSTDNWNGGLAGHEGRRISDLEAKLLSSSNIARNTGGFQGNKGWENLGPSQIEEAIAKSEDLGLEVTGTEGAIAKGVLQDRSMLQHNYFNLQDPARQSSSSRSMAKPVRLTNIREGLEPYAVTDFIKNTNNGDMPPIMGLNFAAISAEQKTFFGNLPESIEGLNTYHDTAVKELMRLHSLDERQARGAWKEMHFWLAHNENNLEAVRKLSYMGQPSKLIRGGLAEIVEKKSYTVHEDMLGGLGIGSNISNGTAIGAVNGNVIDIHNTKRAVLADRRANSDGSITLDIDQYNDLNFAKGDPNSGKRGSMLTLADSDIEAIARGSNKYNRAVGIDSAQISSDVHGFVLGYQDSEKGDIRNAMVNMTSDTMRTLEETGQTDLYDKYASRLSDVGFLDGRTMTYESAQANTRLTSVNRSLSEFDKHVQIATDLMKDAGSRLHELSRTNPEVLSERMRNFVASGKSLQEYYSSASIPMDVAVWDTTLRNQSSEVKITNEMVENLSLHGYHAAAKDLIENSEVVGDLSMNKSMSKYLSGDESAITQVMDVREALGRPAGEVRLSTPEGRLGSIFETTGNKGSDNFIMKFKNGQELPVLGNSAYKGGTNRFGVGEFSGTDLEKHLLTAARKDAKGDLEGFNIAASDYKKSLESVQFGKNSYLRPEAISNNGVGAFLQSRAAKDPFEIGIGRDYLGKITDRSVRDSLLAGETVTGAFGRYPIMNMPLVSLKLDNNLKNGNVGVDERFAALMVQGDHDQDQGFISFFAPGSEAHNEAVEAINSGKQMSELEATAKIQKDVAGELATNYRGAPKTVEERLNAFRTSMRDTGKIKQSRLINRTIGEFSNTYSMLRLGIAQNNNVVSNEERSVLNTLFSEVYQTPISATKGKAGHITLSEAKNVNRSLANSIEGGFDEFYGSLSRAYSFASKASQDALEENKGLLQRYHQGVPDGVVGMSRALTGTTLESGGKVFANIADSVKVTDTLSYLKQGENIAAETSTGAKLASEALGAANEAHASWKNVVRAVRESGASKIIGAGLVAAAGVGLLRTHLDAPKAATNRMRPEEAHPSSNAIPGESVAGSGSANPPRTTVSSSPSRVQSAMVAPIHQTNDVEVNLKSDDRSRASLTSKMIAKLSNQGNTTVTNNYKGNTNLQSLRNKQKIRDAMDES